MDHSTSLNFRFIITEKGKEQHEWARFVTMQHHYNLLAREEEREMIPLCLDEGVGTIIWSPLARGRLARPFEQAKTSGQRLLY